MYKIIPENIKPKKIVRVARIADIFLTGVETFKKIKGLAY